MYIYITIIEVEKNPKNALNTRIIDPKTIPASYKQ